MAIFNSLGSNYSWQDAIICTRELIFPDQSAKKKLKKLLATKFQGKAVLLFNGRDAIEYCLQSYGIGSGDSVLTQAFSCSSLEESINRVGARAVYFDLAQNSLYSTINQVEKTYQNAKNPKAIILQHTLGYSDEVQKIAQFCKHNRVILIEDLAQAVGAVDNQNKQLGKYADAVILSFGKDKILDGVSGGAVIFKDSLKVKPKLLELENWFVLKNDWSNKIKVVKLLFYPTITLLIRASYDFYIGKIFHWLLKKAKILETQIKSPHHHYQSFPAYFAPLVLKRLNTLDKQLVHRTSIALIYWQELHSQKRITLPITKKKIKQGTNLRFPVILNTPKEVKQLLKLLGKNKIYLYDRWYKKAVDSGTFDFNSSYQTGSCPNAEHFSKLIINLPTHAQISKESAKKIANLVKQYLSHD